MESTEGVSRSPRQDAARERIVEARERAQRHAVMVGRIAFGCLWVPFLLLLVVSAFVAAARRSATSWYPSDLVVGVAMVVLAALAFVGGGYAWRRAPLSLPWAGIAACVIGGLLLVPTAGLLLAVLTGRVC